nr:immunoglobulin heavy chain junction region [Mus musculus]MBK4195058.1 immunoglobulin heavy chain junction region [Mus musculus]
CARELYENWYFDVW